MSHPTHVQERNQDATLYVGDLDQQVNEALLWELFLQAGPVANVHIPKDKLTGVHSGYGFVEFHQEDDAEYAMKVMNMIKLFGKAIRVNKASQDKKVDVGANMFVGNLDPDVDEKVLYDTFSAFGIIINGPKIMRDDQNNSKGFAFLGYDSFESSDAAINAMNGQFVSGRPISVSYALKKDSKTERHGSMAERVLAANNPLVKRGMLRPVQPPQVVYTGAGMASAPMFAPPMGFGFPPPPPGFLPPPPGFAGFPPPPPGFMHPSMFAPPQLQ
jgi:splicing factor 3B subunit 4